MCIKPRKTGKFYETKVLGAAGAAGKACVAHILPCVRREENCASS
jgi:hypothetical protein